MNQDGTIKQNLYSQTAAHKFDLHIIIQTRNDQCRTYRAGISEKTATHIESVWDIKSTKLFI